MPGGIILRLTIIYIISTLTLVTLMLLSQLVGNGRYLFYSTKFLKEFAAKSAMVDEPSLISQLAVEKFDNYELLIERGHLENGMLVNRLVDGSIAGECDSLLFSSLRYVALKKMGRASSAALAWKGLINAYDDGRWYRHPLCKKWTSRDMLIGLLAALTQKPPEHKQILLQIMSTIHDNDGYFGDGPPYVSYTTPSVTRLVALLAKHFEIPKSEIPSWFSQGFPTDYYSVAMNTGYRAHLVAMTSWIELEIIGMERLRTITDDTLAGKGGIEQLASVFSMDFLNNQRRGWVADQLVRNNELNIFFRFLRFKAAGAFNERVRMLLLKDLVSMEQFPDFRLPQDCDRKADYLWQRDSREYAPASFICKETFHGVDYLWMTALLSDPKIELGSTNSFTIDPSATIKN
jgi:hypothetical protein